MRSPAPSHNNGRLDAFDTIQDGCIDAWVGLPPAPARRELVDV
jgi:hypothetical protein